MEATLLGWDRAPFQGAIRCWGNPLPQAEAWAMSRRRPQRPGLDAGCEPGVPFRTVKLPGSSFKLQALINPAAMMPSRGKQPRDTEVKS